MTLFSSLTLASLLLLTSTISAGAGATDGRQTFIVRVQSDLKPSVYPDVEHWYSSTLRSLSSSSLSSDEGQSEDGFLHVYRTVFHGFSAKLGPDEAERLKTIPSVLAVFPDEARQLHTTRSPQFLGLVSKNAQFQGLLRQSDLGSDAIIGVLDTGIHPAHRSFHDRDLDPVPARWKGACEEGRGFSKASCNKKIIGARFFCSGYESRLSPAPMNQSIEYRSPRDSDGHGTHTASTAAGRHVRGASLLGYAQGVAAGIAPKARIAVYKVCWLLGCFNSDILAAIDKAVEDGVDVISLSLGGDAVPYILDPIAIGTFGAMERGVFVSASAGNDGPSWMSVSNVAPWMTTVGAGTIDRKFPADVVLGDGRTIRGTSLYSGDPFPANQSLPIVFAGNVSTVSSSPFCLHGSLDPAAVKGKIVLCLRGIVSRAEKGVAVKESGGAGMIIANASPEGEGLVTDAHVLPAVNVGEKEGDDLLVYLNKESDPRATLVFHGTQLDVKPAPVLSSFSARGPNAVTPFIIKPDVIAPGVDILAAWTDLVGPTGLPSDTRRSEFNIMSGTSMSCPHVTGMAALLKGAHPDWSPARIRSALMTTAYVKDNLGNEMVDETHGKASDVWGLGSGHVDPEKSVDPGLVYELTVDDYVDYLCRTEFTDRSIRLVTRREVNCSNRAGNAWELNYPSISVVLYQNKMEKLEITARRTVTNLGGGGGGGGGPSTYDVSVSNPEGASVAVDPPKLVFQDRGQNHTFVVRVSAESVSLPAGGSKTRFGALTWSDGRHSVRSPIAVTWQQPYN